MKQNPLLIPTYKLPLIKRVAQNYPYYRALFWIMLTSLILFPTMATHEWDTIWLIYFSPFILITLWQIASAIFAVTYKSKYLIFKENSKSSPVHSTIDTGAPGTGKSLHAHAETNAMAEGSWEKLSEEYWFLLSRKNKEGYVLTEDDKEIIEAYEYYLNNPGIPCYATNIPVWSEKYRRYSYKFVPDHLKQLSRCPYRLAGWYDEIGTAFDPKLHLDSKNLMNSQEISDSCRYSRQFVELRFVGTEQDGSNIFINLRRVVGLQRLFTETKICLKPKILTWIYKKLMAHFTRKMSLKQSKAFSKFMRLYKKFLSNCGFFKLKYKLIGNTENGAMIDVTGGKNKVTYLPCAFDCVYETRAFRSAYACKDQPINMEVWKNIKLLKNDAIKFLRATNFYEREKCKKGEKDE